MANESNVKLNPGESLTISLHPTINIGGYESIKPMVSVTIQVSDDPDADLIRASQTLKILILRAAQSELAIIEACSDTLGDNFERPALARLLKRLIEKDTGNGEENSEETSPKGRKKARRSKAKRSAVGGS